MSYSSWLYCGHWTKTRLGITRRDSLYKGGIPGSISVEIQNADCRGQRPLLQEITSYLHPISAGSGSFLSNSQAGKPTQVGQPADRKLNALLSLRVLSSGFVRKERGVSLEYSYSIRATWMYTCTWIYFLYCVK